mmetsp:Transcript_1451/g.2630  ORF Transcript_1451/g.2630 Transcript_1451/m.2630 type:complete len:306 (+) Transcript_1451:331-1248(+)
MRALWTIADVEGDRLSQADMSFVDAGLVREQVLAIHLLDCLAGDVSPALLGVDSLEGAEEHVVLLGACAPATALAAETSAEASGTLASEATAKSSTKAAAEAPLATKATCEWHHREAFASPALAAEASTSTWWVQDADVGRQRAALAQLGLELHMHALLRIDIAKLASQNEAVLAKDGFGGWASNETKALFAVEGLQLTKEGLQAIWAHSQDFYVCSPGALVALRHIEGDLVTSRHAEAVQIVLHQEHIGPVKILRIGALNEAPTLVGVEGIDGANVRRGSHADLHSHHLARQDTKGQLQHNNHS